MIQSGGIDISRLPANAYSRTFRALRHPVSIRYWIWEKRGKWFWETLGNSGESDTEWGAVDSAVRWIRDGQ